jgi:signal transduction histidine kinase/DNA-binding response OmpR family regulator
MPKRTNQKAANPVGDIPYEILIVDDEIPNLQLLSELLNKDGYHVRQAKQPQMAIKSAVAQPPSLILLDLRMPGMDGFEVCERLKQNARTSDIPIIFISAMQDAESRIRGFDSGGVDYITKPFQEEEVLARVQTHLELRNMQLNLADLVDKRTAALNQANQELRKSEERFRSLMEQSPLAIAILTTEGKISEVNAAWQQLWGFNEEEVRQVLEKYNVLTDQQTRDLGIAPLVEKAFAGEQVILPPIDYAVNRTMADIGLEQIKGRSRWIQCHLFAIRTMSGEIAHVVNTYVDITEQKQAERDRNAYQERLRALASELTMTEERERRRIATELHDGAAQSLAFARIQLASASKAIAEAETAKKLDDVSLTLRESLGQIREVLLDLSSPSMNEIGLGVAISEWLEQQIGRRHGLKTSFTNQCGKVPLDDDVRAVLFRNTRELLTNVVKHARATTVAVRMEAKGDALQITIEDDGVGLNPDNAVDKSHGGFGIFSIRERMFDLGGSLEIVSARGKGCEATLVMPLERDEQRN